LITSKKLLSIFKKFSAKRFDKESGSVSKAQKKLFPSKQLLVFEEEQSFLPGKPKKLKIFPFDTDLEAFWKGKIFERR